MTDIEQQFDRECRSSRLTERYLAIKRDKALRRREIAAALGVSEAGVIDAQCDVRSIRLNQEFGAIIEQLPSLGYILTLTRNDHAVHERKGIYENVRVMSDDMALVISGDRKIDLRIILRRWKFGFAVMEPADSGVRCSLQFFDQCGVAIQKIFLQAQSDESAWLALLRRFRAADQGGELAILPNDAHGEDEPVLVCDEEVDVAQLDREWSEMTDVHQFFGILRRHKVGRQQAFRLLGAPRAQAFDPASIETVLMQAADQQIPLMCFVGNRGNIQIHSGVVKNIKRAGTWLNVMDPEFTLHLQQQGVIDGWLVRKPTRDGVVTSLELYDAPGDLVVQFFGVRQEGQPENPLWRRLAESALTPGQRAA